LGSVCSLADAASDAEWACRGPATPPVELARMVRTQAKPTIEEGRRRREARHLRLWWREESGMLAITGELPDIDGARFKAVIEQMTERMRPARGQPWDTFAHRAADALIELATKYESIECDAPTRAPRPLLQVSVPRHGPATVAGIPLPDGMIE